MLFQIAWIFDSIIYFFMLDVWDCIIWFCYHSLAIVTTTIRGKSIKLL
jgi:hypothetical protein